MTLAAEDLAGLSNAINQGGALGVLALLIVGAGVVGKWVALPLLTTFLAIIKEQATVTTMLMELQREARRHAEILERMVTRTPPRNPPT